MELVVLGQRRRRHVVGTAPHLHLRLTVERGGLGLVETRETTVHTLVQVPRAYDRDPMEIELVLHVEERLDGALEHAREGNVERVALITQGLRSNGHTYTHVRYKTCRGVPSSV